MKYFALLVLIVGIILLNSCCQKKSCIGVDDIQGIELVYFTESDMDSAMMVTYEKNSDFCTSIDTFKLLEYEYNQVDSVGILLMKERLNTNLDYKLIMPFINQSYELTEFILKKQECNYCFPTGYDHYTVLESYQINGKKTTKSGLFLQITKSTDQKSL